jgi:hypothetical protein
MNTLQTTNCDFIIWPPAPIVKNIHVLQQWFLTFVRLWPSKLFFYKMTQPNKCQGMLLGHGPAVGKHYTTALSYIKLPYNFSSSIMLSKRAKQCHWHLLWINSLFEKYGSSYLWSSNILIVHSFIFILSYRTKYIHIGHVHFRSGFIPREFALMQFLFDILISF